MNNKVKELKQLLNNSVDSTPEKVSMFFKKKEGEYAYHDKFMGVTVPTLRLIAKKFLGMNLMDLSLLIKSEINEERLITLIILNYKYVTSNEPDKEEIFQFYLNNVAYVNNWNLVDSSAHIIIGSHLFAKKSLLLHEMAKSQNIWQRRIAIIATLYFIRKSELDLTFEIAEILISDPHDLIHKAVGWMLREAGKRDQERLISFLKKNSSLMPRTMLRYASEKLSLNNKK